MKWSPLRRAREAVHAHRFFTTKDIKALRKKAGVSQSTFAAMLGVSNRTLQDWEQGRRIPTGPAMNLLRLYEAMPEAITELLAEEPALTPRTNAGADQQ